MDNIDFDINGTCFAAMDYMPGQPMAFQEFGTDRTVVAIAVVPIHEGDIVMIDLASKTAGLATPHLKLIEGDKNKGGRV